MEKRAIRERYCQQALQDIQVQMPRYYEEYREALQGNALAVERIEMAERALLVPCEMRFWLKEFCTLDRENEKSEQSQGLLYVQMLLHLTGREQCDEEGGNIPRDALPQRIAALLVRRFQEYRNQEMLVLPEPLHDLECLLWILADLYSQMLHQGVLSVVDKAKQLTVFSSKPVLQYVREGILLFVDGVFDEKKYFEQVLFLDEKWRKKLASEAEVLQSAIVRRYLEMLAVRAAEKTLAEAAKRYLPEKACREFLCYLDRVSLLRCCHSGLL